MSAAAVAAGAMRGRTLPVHVISPAVLEHVGRACPYCGIPMARKGRRCVSRDHVLPRSRGGARRASNVLIVCRTCNFDKADRTLGEWLKLLRGVGDPRALFVETVLERCQLFEYPRKVVQEEMPL